jgi:pimeloyl-ACP methyl ester carboxylesterase
LTRLATGAQMRRTGPEGGLPVVCLGGGTGAEHPGRWNSGYRWLIDRLAPRHPAVAFHEVRYRVRSWKRLGPCIEDAWAALDAVADPSGRPTLLVGYSMGGAVAVSVADHATVAGVVGLAPWIPSGVDVERLRGRWLAALHGTLDGSWFGFPGVSPRSSLAGVERARAAGVEASHQLIRGGIHAIAFPLPLGLLAPAPRAGAWLRQVDAQVARFQAEADAP